MFILHGWIKYVTSYYDPCPLFLPLGQMLQQSYKIHDLYNEITICSQKYWNLQHKQYEKQQNAKLTTKNDLLYPTESWPSDQIPYTKINQSKPDKNNLTTISIKKPKEMPHPWISKHPKIVIVPIRINILRILNEKKTTW